MLQKDLILWMNLHFTDLEPAAAGTQDPYVWKYLFTISPSDVIKFDSTEYIVLPMIGQLQLTHKYNQLGKQVIQTSIKTN